MSFAVRAILWVLLIVAPGGVLLLPLLVGDEVARRRRRRTDAQDAPSAPVPGDPAGEPAPLSSPAAATAR